MISIQILGAGCPKCKTLFANAEAAVKATGIEAAIEKVEDIQQIVKLGVMMTPAIVVDGKVASSGKVLSVDDISALLRESSCGCEHGADAPAAEEGQPAPCACRRAPGPGETSAETSTCCDRPCGLKKGITIALLLFVVASVAYVVIRETGMRIAVSAASPAHGDSVVRTDALAVYYFHGTRRCQTCNKIEALTRSAVETRYQQELKDGKIVFRSINMEETGNERFVAAFELTSNAVVMQKEGRFEKFDAIWDLVGDSAAFTSYIQDGVAKLLGE